MRAKLTLASLAVLGWAVSQVGAAEPALTIYNQDFAVVREQIELDLADKVCPVEFTGITAHLEPDSVMLRDPAGKHPLQILEQNYRADPVSEGLLLSFSEGKTIDFMSGSNIVQGKIIRSGYVPHASAYSRYGQDYRARQYAYSAPGSGGQPIIEVEGKVRFSLPGIPLFPGLNDALLLKPTLQWLLASDKKGKVKAELSYVTGGMRWEAAYNVVTPEKGELLDIVGWVTMDNQSGRAFENAQIKLMAGDVSKIKADYARDASSAYEMKSSLGGGGKPPVSEKTFDEYHLYTLARRTTLHDRETKQVEFIRASEVNSQTLYIYDGAVIDQQRYRGWNSEGIRNDRDYGTQSNPKVWVMREFENSEKNHLGMPLPKGRVRFYRRDADGQLEFTGENVIDHTPRDEKARFYTGNAFDLTGERRRTDYKMDSGQKWLDEAFEIKLKNHKKTEVEIRVVEHLYRWVNWEIKEVSNTYSKTDSQTVEFRIQLKPDAEQTVTYTVHYSW